MSRLRDSKGRFVKTGSASTSQNLDQGANRGDQTWGSVSNIPAGIELNQASLNQLLADPALLKGVVDRTTEIMNTANRLAITDDAYYGMIVYNNRPELGPVGVVFCDNYKSVIDDAYHSTLHKVMANMMKPTI